jgi:hypothetical protein
MARKNGTEINDCEASRQRVAAAATLQEINESHGNALELTSDEGDIYRMGERSVWIEVDSVSVWIRRSGNAVVVELCRTGDEAQDTLDTAQASLDDDESEDEPEDSDDDEDDDEWDKFIGQYTLKKNHLDDNASGDGFMFETYGAEVEFVKAQDPKCIWTLVTGDDDEEIVVQGWHYVNRMGYFISEQPAKTEGESYRY